MGKYDGFLICTDLDDTLLTTDKKVSEENLRAIREFMGEGGLFTFATGRSYMGVRDYLEYIKPNAPIVCFNGAAVYDYKKKEYLWSTKLAPGAGEIIDYIENRFDFVGTEIVTIDKGYMSRENARTIEHEKIERLDYKRVGWREIKDEWIKVIFMQEEHEVDLVRKALAERDYHEKYNFVQSSPYYYEVLPKDATKGDAALKLCEIMGVEKEKSIGIGDNENDIALIEKLGTGFAVANAKDYVKSHADKIAPHHNENAIAWVIKNINI